MSALTVAVLVVCFASVALADDFKTIKGKEYKDATISRVEADGIVIKTKTGISKIYFVELPKDVQERFHYGYATPTGKAVMQRITRPKAPIPPPRSFRVPIGLRALSKKSSTSGNRSYRENTRPARQS